MPSCEPSWLGPCCYSEILNHTYHTDKHSSEPWAQQKPCRIFPRPVYISELHESTEIPSTVSHYEVASVVTWRAELGIALSVKTHRRSKLSVQLTDFETGRHNIEKPGKSLSVLGHFSAACPKQESRDSLVLFDCMIPLSPRKPPVLVMTHPSNKDK